ncbi:unnamed protein product [Adineta ricciae]|nr:unnamed protein product [Adineta ricciae]
MKSTPFTPMGYAQGQLPGLSSEILGFDNASLLFYVGGGCLLLVLVFGIILCRLDVSAGDRRRAQYGIRIEN